MGSKVPVFLAVVVFLMAGAVLGGCADSEIGDGDFWNGGGFDPSKPGPVAGFSFDGTTRNQSALSLVAESQGTPSFVDGLDGQAVRFSPDGSTPPLAFHVGALPLESSEDFSVQFWVRSEAEAGEKFVLLSQKAFPDNSLASQKNPGWVLYSSGGTWAWSLGAGERRLTYERDNGSHMPLNDGRWHQLTMTHNSALSEFRLFYDGVNWASYHVTDSDGFDFSNDNPLVVGWNGQGMGAPPGTPQAIVDGAAQLQELVDAFNSLGLPEVEADEFVRLIVDPRELFGEKVEEVAGLRGAGGPQFRESMAAANWEPVSEAKSALMSNPYTVHQNLNFTGIAPVARIYDLVDGSVVIEESAAAAFAEKETLTEPDFEMDNLGIWDRVLSSEEVHASYSAFLEPTNTALDENLTSLNAAAWNIWHGGKHFTVADDGWDSRLRIAEMIREENADVVMMQETYSSGDFIAAELGYYFATTVDWDYLNQGANISVLSRYPIREIYVQDDSPFQNVGTKVSISRTQDLYVMSNWYGMGQFPAVFEFHQSRFSESDTIPVLFAGDFNAVPHTDGGDSPASMALVEAGFTDAFRSLFPNVQEFPGPTHRNGRRIDQLYYKGAGLNNVSTEVISTHPRGFPSDHFMILSSFELDYSTRASVR